MNEYEKKYYELCERALKIPVIDRIRDADITDKRLNIPESSIYTERHHILPKHAGGNDNCDNIVVLLPEEHLQAHYYRYKAYGERSDFLACRLIINGFQGKKSIDTDLFCNSKTYMTTYSLYRQELYEFRTKVGWHTEDGLKRLANSRIGKMLCVDSITGEKVGMHPVDHPNVLNGTWVNYYKGKICVLDTITGERKHIPKDEVDNRRYIPTTKFINDLNAGANNPNYKELTIERRERLFGLVNDSLVDGYFSRGTFTNNLKAEFTEFKKISMVWVTNNFGSVNEFLNEYNRLHNTNITLPPKGYKSEACKAKLRAINLGKTRKKDEI